MQPTAAQISNATQDAQAVHKKKYKILDIIFSLVVRTDRLPAVT